MENKQKVIGIAADHAGYELKEILKKELISTGLDVKDFGTYSSESMDYPDVAHPLALSVISGECNSGFAICGSGNGICMTVNKHHGIRAALCWNKEICTLSREHNDANVCCLPARFISSKEALEIARIFLETPFEGGRHQRRRDKIDG